MAWRIDRDYLNPNSDDEYNRVGTMSMKSFNPDMPRYRFRLLDDDGEVYYGGEFDCAHDDEGADWQSSPLGALKWAERDAGAVDFQMHADDALEAGLTSSDMLRDTNKSGRDWVSIY